VGRCRVKRHKIDAWVVHYADQSVDLIYSQDAVIQAIQGKQVRKVIYWPQTRTCVLDRIGNTLETCYMCEREGQA
jgi:hypothetical protein